METIDVHELQRRLAAGAVTVVDVRMHEELQLAALPQVTHIPLHELPMRLGELNPSAALAILCHHGVRSEMAARLLERNGFSHVSNIAGGIDAWSANIDPAVPRY